MPRAPLAFYDLDGTLVASNVVTQYAWFARRQPRRLRAVRKTAKLILSIPILFALDLYSRALFNRVFYREYRGLSEDWLRGAAPVMDREVLQPATFPGAASLIESDRREGYLPVLVTGSLDFALAPLIERLGFHDAVCNCLAFNGGIATGGLVPPVLAGLAKVDALRALAEKHGVELADCKAYSDSLSDLPMLEAVGHPVAANPDRRLHRIARERGWPIVDLKHG
jgi:HAD superfamily hydrolase (TIGR01490 family)